MLNSRRQGRDKQPNAHSRVAARPKARYVNRIRSTAPSRHSGGECFWDQAAAAPTLEKRKCPPAPSLIFAFGFRIAASSPPAAERTSQKPGTVCGLCLGAAPFRFLAPNNRGTPSRHKLRNSVSPFRHFQRRQCPLGESVAELALLPLGWQASAALLPSPKKNVFQKKDTQKSGSPGPP